MFVGSWVLVAASVAALAARQHTSMRRVWRDAKDMLGALTPCCCGQSVPWSPWLYGGIVIRGEWTPDGCIAVHAQHASGTLVVTLVLGHKFT